MKCARARRLSRPQQMIFFRAHLHHNYGMQRPLQVPTRAGEQAPEKLSSFRKSSLARAFFRLFGIEFLKFVHATQITLSDGQFMALAVVKSDRVIRLKL